MSSCSYNLLKSEFDSLKQNDPEFQKLLAIYEPGKPKNKSEYGFMIDMLTLQSATKNDKMMRKKSRIAAQYNGTYTKNEPILDRLAGVEDLIDEMEKAGCGYGLRVYYNQQKAKQQHTTQKAPNILNCLNESLLALERTKGIKWFLLQCTVQAEYLGLNTIELELRHSFTIDHYCDVSLSFPTSLVEQESYIDGPMHLDTSTFNAEEKTILRFAYLFNNVFLALSGKYDKLPPLIQINVNYHSN